MAYIHAEETVLTLLLLHALRPSSFPISILLEPVEGAAVVSAFFKWADVNDSSDSSFMDDKCARRPLQ